MCAQSNMVAHHMPTPEELKIEIEKEKTNFYIQHPELNLNLTQN